MERRRTGKFCFSCSSGVTSDSQSVLHLCAKAPKVDCFYSSKEHALCFLVRNPLAYCPSSISLVGQSKKLYNRFFLFLQAFQTLSFHFHFLLLNDDRCRQKRETRMALKEMDNCSFLCSPLNFSKSHLVTRLAHSMPDGFTAGLKEIN